MTQTDIMNPFLTQRYHRKHSSFTIASVNAETRGIALAGKLEELELELELELVIELLAMTLTRKSPRHLAPTWLIS